MSRTICLALAFFLMASHPAKTQRMDNKKMEKIFEKAAIKVEGEPGTWMPYYSDYIRLLFTDERNYRMRVFTSIV